MSLDEHVPRDSGDRVAGQSVWESGLSQDALLAIGATFDDDILIDLLSCLDGR